MDTHIEETVLLLRGLDEKMEPPNPSIGTPEACCGMLHMVLLNQIAIMRALQTLTATDKKD